jgi:diphthine synthase
MTLTFISLGLSDVKDISVKGLEAVKDADVVYLEHYTSVLISDVSELESFYGKKIVLATRTMVEGDDNCILTDAETKKVAFLVVGDAFGATTHSDLFLRAKQKNVDVNVIHNSSILTAIGVCGLQLYQFGKTTSMVFFDTEWKPHTAYDVVKQNQEHGLHTLCLLDIKVAEPTKEDLAAGKTEAQEPRFMTINQALSQYLEMETERGDNVITEDTKVVGVARVGCSDQQIVYGTVKELLDIDFGAPLHSLIIPGRLHFHEEEVLDLFRP